jgi:hypothetical protein
VRLVGVVRENPNDLQFFVGGIDLVQATRTSLSGGECAGPGGAKVTRSFLGDQVRHNLAQLEHSPPRDLLIRAPGMPDAFASCRGRSEASFR